MMKTLFWFRRDLRLHDSAALSEALNQDQTYLVFVFDPHILNKLKNKHDRRVTFIYESLKELEVKIQQYGSSLIIRYGKPEEEIPKLASELAVSSVFCNRDYEPYAKERDRKVKQKLSQINIRFEQHKDIVIYEKEEIRTGLGDFYKVYTPYKNKWLETFEKQDRSVAEFECSLKRLAAVSSKENILTFDWYQKIRFQENMPDITPGTKAAHAQLKHFVGIMGQYGETRNYPDLNGTSGLSTHLRHGNISIREMVKLASDKTWLSELIWREFYQMILDAHPRIVNTAFKAEYDKIKWKGNPAHFKNWCQGETGYPLIDAAMRCFYQTGLMHNRLRMIVASFLCKTLLLDWRLGEEYFAQILLDYDLAANNGGWQWCSSSGADAQPYFRIFNPYMQSEKFDPEGNFIRVWCPELSHLSNKDIHRGEGKSIVSYETNRIRCLEMYLAAKKD